MVLARRVRLVSCNKKVLIASQLCRRSRYLMYCQMTVLVAHKLSYYMTVIHKQKSMPIVLLPLVKVHTWEVMKRLLWEVTGRMMIKVIVYQAHPIPQLKKCN